MSIVRMALKEDIGRGDITTKLIIPAKKRTKAIILAKEAGIVCGLDVARLVFRTVDKRICFKPTTKDGKKVKKGQVLARLEGEARSILKAERVALNFLSRLSGIATLTDKYVQRVKLYRVKIMDTRKTAPGLRILEKYAVRCGGGTNHRMGLWDQVLVKDNHIKIQNSKIKMQNLKQLIKKVRTKIPKRIKVEIEVTNLRQFKQAFLAKPDIIMLDNFTLKNIRKAVKLRNEPTDQRTNKPTKLEISGGVHLNNVRRIAATGVERISIGKLTHSAKVLDVALNCE